VTACAIQGKYPARALLLLAAALAGALLAASGIFEGASNQLPADAIAQLPGKTIGRADYLQLLEQVRADRRSPMSADDRWRLLDRLIEEQLLVNRSLELGLPRTNARVRKAIVSSMLEMAINDAASTSGSAEVAVMQYMAELHEVASVSIREDALAGHASLP
jgi:hypothetical protein